MEGQYTIIKVENNSSQPVHTVILPDNSLVLALQYGNAVYEIIGGKKVALPEIHLCGLLTHKKEYVREPGAKTILVKFQPWMFNRHFDGMHEIVDCNVDCSELVITEDIYPEGDKKILSLLNKVLSFKQADASVSNAISIIKEKKGQVRIDDLAEEVCNSKRNFERKFKATTGLSPKTFIQMTRQSYSRLLLKQSCGLSDVTYDCGFYDQSHFIHQFKEVTGTTPESYKTNILPIENWALASKNVL
ncbi:MAG: helix-turn-helix transcriptional regulator [Bacteroidota bacterium]